MTPHPDQERLWRDVAQARHIASVYAEARRRILLNAVPERIVVRGDGEVEQEWSADIKRRLDQCARVAHAWVVVSTAVATFADDWTIRHELDMLFHYMREDGVLP